MVLKHHKMIYVRVRVGIFAIALIYFVEKEDTKILFDFLLF